MAIERVESKSGTKPEDNPGGFYLGRLASFIAVRDGLRGVVPFEYQKLVNKAIFGSYRAATQYGLRDEAADLLAASAARKVASTLSQQRGDIVNS